MIAWLNMHHLVTSSKPGINNTIVSMASDRLSGGKASLDIFYDMN